MYIGTGGRGIRLCTARHCAGKLTPATLHASALLCPRQGRGRLNRDACPAVVTSVESALKDGTAELAQELAAELKDVKDTIDTLRKIVRIGGMPAVSAVQQGGGPCGQRGGKYSWQSPAASAAWCLPSRHGLR